MKRIALLVLALVINVIADEEEHIARVAAHFETDVPTVKTCLGEAGTTMHEMHIAKRKWKEIKDGDDIDEETKESITSHGHFFACMLEKKDMMKDSKLVLDKILEIYEKKQEKLEKRGITKEIITECVNKLNSAETTREDRAFGFMLCMRTRSKETVAKNK